MNCENIPFDLMVEHDELGALNAQGTYSYNAGRRHGHPDTWEPASYEVNVEKAAYVPDGAPFPLTAESRELLADSVLDQITQRE